MKIWWGLLTGDEAIGNAFNKTPKSTFQILPASQPSEVIHQLLYHHLIYFTRTGDFTWRVSDSEELVGVTHRR